MSKIHSVSWYALQMLPMVATKLKAREQVRNTRQDFHMADCGPVITVITSGSERLQRGEVTSKCTTARLNTDSLVFSFNNRFYKFKVVDNYTIKFHQKQLTFSLLICHALKVLPGNCSLLRCHIYFIPTKKEEGDISVNEMQLLYLLLSLR